MGISGLLPFVKNACRQGNIRELHSKSVAVDVSCFLHRGLVGCMDKIHMGENTQGYVHYVERYIKELISLDCHVVMVFDGRPLPAKKQTNDDRRDQRDKNMQDAELLLAKGFEKEARDKYRLATKISSDIVETTIRHFRTWKNVDIVVAPYEADAQLAYLMKSNLVDAVITEDSDLIVFDCQKIYFKWQSGSGECSIYERHNLSKCFTGEMSGDKFDFVKFRRICILAGCDYLQAGLPGVGLSTATKFFSKTSISDLKSVLKKIPSYLNNPKLKSHVNSEFINGFIRAENTFLHQIVFDPKERCQRPLNPYPIEEIIDLDNDCATTSSTVDKFDYAGTICTQKLAQRLALGNGADGGGIADKFLLINPQPGWSVWSDKYESKGTIEKREKNERETKETTCGAFKLDSSNVKRVKKSESNENDPEKPKKRKKFDISMDDDDDIVAQFMQDVEKEKEKLKKRKNAPELDYSAEMLMHKYGGVKKQKLQQSAPVEIDDFDEIFEVKKLKEKSENLEKKSVEVESTEEVIKPPPIIRKVVSSPTIKNVESPVLMRKNSSPVVTNPPAKKVSKYFADKDSKSSPRVSNPFRCPAFVKSTPNVEKSSENVEEKKNEISVLGGLEDKEQNSETPSSFKNIGFKVSGLRRRSSTGK